MTSIPYLIGDIRIAVIGGGAAGFFAALNTAEKNPRARITIFEAAAKPLQKVLISGGGRCNLTHACFDPVRLTEFYPRGQKELRSLFTRFQPRDTMTWFENRGLQLKTEPDGRVFPVTDRSQDVIGLFLDQAEKLRIRLRTQTRVESITHQNGQFMIASQGKAEPFDACILSTGYSPPGWKLAENLGHTILPPVPSLFPFTVKDPVISGLQGISLPHVRGRLTVDTHGKPQKLEAEGALLITHTGLSGPVIYRLSAWGARALAEVRYQARLQLDLLPELEEEPLRNALQKLLMETEAKKKLENTHFPPLPNRLWLSLLSASGANLDDRGEFVSKKTLNRLVETLKRLPLAVSGKSPSKEEFVSCGGVPLKEVDFKTMQSRRVPNLYFGGEILDIDGLTGGFNFQACWSEGWAISEALAKPR
ncbi:MAG TPA: NAD(P)/FAD-dependent oxidoreductase [Coleofasciculaceae cyanobacterium]|jgi:hypothetical protein